MVWIKYASSGAQKLNGFRARAWSAVSTPNSESAIFHSQHSVMATGLPAAAGGTGDVQCDWQEIEIDGVNVEVDEIHRLGHILLDEGHRIGLRGAGSGPHLHARYCRLLHARQDLA